MIKFKTAFIIEEIPKGSKHRMFKLIGELIAHRAKQNTDYPPRPLDADTKKLVLELCKFELERGRPGYIGFDLATQVIEKLGADG